MLLDEIIHNKYKQENNENNEDKVSVLVADLRKGKEPLFGGDGGVVDLCVVNNFKYVKEPLNEEDIDKWGNAKIRRIFSDYDCWEEQQKQEKQNKEVIKIVTVFNTNFRL